MALTELFVADLATTTISSGGTDAPAPGTVETLTVASAAMFGTAVAGVSQFHFADTAPGKGSEVFAATSTSGTTWTAVTRGAEGTTPVTHTAGFTIQQVFTTGWLADIAQLTPGALPWLLANVDAVSYQSCTYDAYGQVTASGITWPDGTTGAYAAATGLVGGLDVVISQAWTWAGSVTHTVTQGAMTYNSAGQLTAQPALTAV